MSNRRKNNPLNQFSIWEESSLWGSGQSTSPFGSGGTEEKGNTMSTQIENLSTRIDASGFNSQEVLDERNTLQKLFNLNKDQGFIMGTLEVLNRPTKAIAGAFQELTRSNEIKPLDGSANAQDYQRQRELVEKAGQGILERMGEGFMQGLTGEQDYYWGQVVRNVAQGGKEEDGTLDWTDIVGTFLDMTLDPVQLALIPITGGASAAVKGVDAASDISKVAKAGQALDKATDAVNVLDKGFKGAKIADGLSDAAKMASGADIVKDVASTADTARKALVESKNAFGALKSIARGARNTLGFVGEATDINNYLFTKAWRDTHMSVVQASARGIASGVKFAGRKTGDVIGTVFENYAKNNPQKYQEVIDNYGSFKNAAKNMFLRSDVDVNRISQINKNQLNEFYRIGDDKMMAMFKRIQDTADSGVLSQFDNANDVSQQLSRMYEFLELTETQVKAGDLLNRVVYGKETERLFNYSDELINSLNTLFKDDIGKLGINVIENNEGRKFVKFSSDFWDKFKYLDNTSAALDELIQGKSTKSILETIASGGDLAKDWTREVVDLGTAQFADDVIESLTLSQQDPAFMELYKDFSGTWETVRRDFGSVVYGDANALFKKGSKQGYIPHTFNPEVKAQLDELSNTLGFDLSKNAEDFFEGFGTQGQATLAARNLNMRSAYESNLIMKEYFSNLFQKERFIEGMFDGASIEDIEKYKDILTNTDWFIEDARINMVDFMTGHARYMSNSKLKSEVLLRTTFDGAMDGRSGLKVLKEGVDNRVPAGAEILSTSEVRNLYSSIDNFDTLSTRTGEKPNKYITELKKSLKNALVDGGSTQIALDKRVKKVIGHSTKNSGEAMLAFYDDFMGQIRGNKLLSPGYNIRNASGNAFNMWFSGMSTGDIIAGWADADDIIKFVDGGGSMMTAPDDWKEAVGLYERMRREGAVGSTFKSLYGVDEVSTMMSQGTDLESLESLIKTQGKKTGIRGAYESIKDVNMNLNQALDDRSRLAIALHAQKNPEYMATLGGLLDPVDAARFVAFDPNDLTNFENDVVKRATMFYTFARQNVIFQAKNLVYNTDRYYRMKKFFDLLSSGVPEEDRSEWDGDLDIQINRGDGTYTLLKTANPFQEVVDTVQDPLGALVNMVNPIAKAPFEIATDRQMWDGSKVSDDYLGYITGIAGLDVPLRAAGTAKDMTITALLEGDIQGASDLLGQFFNVTRSRNVQSNRNSQEYRELERLKTFVEKQKKKGNAIPTLQELRDAGLVK